MIELKFLLKLGKHEKHDGTTKTRIARRRKFTNPDEYI
jgi:hypothetical protein